MSEPADPAAVAMRLRPQPKPVLRLSRKFLIGASSVAAVGLATLLVIAIAPPKPKMAAAAPAEGAPKHTPASSEALNGLPKDYTDVPKLGPPLPGDLGRPILANAAANGTSVSAMANASALPTTQAQAQRAERVQQAEQVRLAAHSSQIFFQQSASSGDLASAAAAPQPASPAALLAALTPSAAAQLTTEADRKQSFLNRASDTQTASDARLSAPVSPYVLLTGSVVPAALITGLRSDIPGQVLAQVTQDVYDSVSGRYLLIPKGARLIGEYDNAVSFGQSRILLVWKRLIMPDGESLILEKLSAADAGGYAGLQDRVDYHWAGIINAAAVSTLLGIGAQSGDPQSDSALVRVIRDGAGESINRAGQQIVERQLAVQPTITIRPGMPVRVILSRDLVLAPYGE